MNTKTLIVILQYKNTQHHLMGLAKTEIFTAQQNKLSLFSKAFGHPARIAILQHLFKSNSCVCGDLVNEIGLAQPTISQHLKELKNLDLIKGCVEGTRVTYCINVENWKAMKSLMNEFLDQDLMERSSCTQKK